MVKNEVRGPRGPGEFGENLFNYTTMTRNMFGNSDVMLEVCCRNGLITLKTRGGKTHEAHHRCLSGHVLGHGMGQLGHVSGHALGQVF